MSNHAQFEGALALPPQSGIVSTHFVSKMVRSMECKANDLGSSRLSGNVRARGRACQVEHARLL
jgi:hypothetical protein